MWSRSGGCHQAQKVVASSHFCWLLRFRMTQHAASKKLTLRIAHDAARCVKEEKLTPPISHDAARCVKEEKLTPPMSDDAARCVIWNPRCQLFDAACCVNPNWKCQYYLSCISVANPVGSLATTFGAWWRYLCCLYIPWFWHLLIKSIWLQWLAYSDTFPLSRRCHCKRGRLYTRRLR